jgi:uncharacterized membrane protein YjjP (DUF1212 family)
MEPSLGSVEPKVGEPDPAAVGFILELVRALHTHGESAQRLEDVTEVVAERLQLHDAQFFSTPTSIMASFGPLAHQRTHMLRVRPGDVDLGKLAAVEQVSTDVARGRRSLQEGIAALSQIASGAPPYGAVLTTLAYGVASGAACQFLGGGGREVLAAAILGLGLGSLGRIAAPYPRLGGGVFEPLAAFFVSVAAVGLARLAGPLSVVLATLGGLIVLMPGLTLTTALSELATRHLASGTARLSGAFITFLSVAFGVALGNRVGEAVFGSPLAGASTALPAWASWVALAVAPLSFMVILRAEVRDAPWIVTAGAIGVLGGRFGAAAFGVELGAFVGAFAVALGSSLFERWRNRPAALVQVPGLLLLVPGTVGFRSITALMERQAVAGVETAFSAILTAVALVAGLLTAGVAAPAPRLRDISGR